MALLAPKVEPVAALMTGVVAPVAASEVNRISPPAETKAPQYSPVVLVNVRVPGPALISAALTMPVVMGPLRVTLLLCVSTMVLYGLPTVGKRRPMLFVSVIDVITTRPDVPMTRFAFP